jgi:hypothetical protein
MIFETDKYKAENGKRKAKKDLNRKLIIKHLPVTVNLIISKTNLTVHNSL